jgi:DNA-binding transcriptional MerR regulator
MITLNETSDAARVLGVSEKRLRRLIAREVVTPTAKTVRGTVLFDEQDLERAKKRLEMERAQ